ncbi:unnamed protein product, partial [Meganyctiphanes norvegica]
MLLRIALEFWNILLAFWSYFEMSETHLYTMVTRNNLTKEQISLFELVRSAGIVIHPKIFKTLMELLELNVPPHALLTLLRDVSNKVPSAADDINDNLMPDEPRR